jgi:hypothetical protein
MPSNQLARTGAGLPSSGANRAAQAGLRQCIGDIEVYSGGLRNVMQKFATFKKWAITFIATIAINLYTG